MRVNLGTIVLTDDQLYGIGLVQGEFRKATRSEVKTRLVGLIAVDLAVVAEPVAGLTAQYELTEPSEDTDEIFPD